MKSGTTSLYAYLSQHPQLLASKDKEVHYFDGGLEPAVDNFSKGEEWYRAQFLCGDSLPCRRVAFEASPLYLFHPLVPQRMAALLPGAEIIVLLRNPVQRAISHYFHSKRNHNEHLPIQQALEAEEARLAPILQRKDYKNPQLRFHSYKSRGHYSEQLERYFAHFPKSKLHVFSSEVFFADPLRVVSSICRLLQIEPSFIPADLKPLNVGNNRIQVDPQVLASLTAYFRQHNESLCQLLGENFGW